MVAVESVAVRSGPVTLVGGIVENDHDGPRCITLTAQTDGRVHPPRRHGIPVTGWTEDAVDLTLGAGERRAVGYATDGHPIDSPLVVSSVDRLGDAPGPTGPDGSLRTPTAVIRALGDPRPPRGSVAVPTQTPDGTPGAGPREQTDEGDAVVAADTSPLVTVPPPTTVQDRSEPDPPPTDAAGRESTDQDGQSVEETAESVPSPTSMRAEVADHDPMATPRELDGLVETVAVVAERIDRAETLAASDDLPTAADQLEAIGGLGGARELARTVEADGEQLAALATRAQSLAERAAAVDIPLETYEKLS